MSFTIRFLILSLKTIGKYQLTNLENMLRVLDMIIKLTLPILLINKLFFTRKLFQEKILNLNFEVVFLKTIKDALNKFLHGAIQLLLQCRCGRTLERMGVFGGLSSATEELLLADRCLTSKTCQKYSNNNPIK